MEKSTKVNSLRKERISNLKIFEDSCIVSYKMNKRLIFPTLEKALLNMNLNQNFF